MKLQTIKANSKVKVVSIGLLILFFTSLIFTYLDIQLIENIDEPIVLISLLLLIYLSYLGCAYFKYDSEGETLIFQNKKALAFSPFVREAQSDFPKRKLVRFEVKNKILFKKKLYIYITSKRYSKGVTKISFDISYLNSKQIRDVKTSLNRVIKENEEQEHKSTAPVASMI